MDARGEQGCGRPSAAAASGTDAHTAQRSGAVLYAATRFPCRCCASFTLLEVFCSCIVLVQRSITLTETRLEERSRCYSDAADLARALAGCQRGGAGRWDLRRTRVGLQRCRHCRHCLML